MQAPTRADYVRVYFTSFAFRTFVKQPRRVGSAGGAMRIDGNVYYVLKDRLGSAYATTDATGNVVGEMRYYAFGETRLSTGTMLTDRLFTGQRYIAELGIYHYNARFYSPKLGRFLSADTLMAGFASPQNLNRFSYVANNPVRYTDPSGHMLMADTEGGGGGGYTPSAPDDYCATHPWVCGGGGGGGGDSDDGGGGGGGEPGGGSGGSEDPNSGCDLECRHILDVWASLGINYTPANLQMPNLPQTQVVHLIDPRNMPSIQTPIYDYSTIPPKIIGYRVTEYVSEEVHFDPVAFIVPSDPITWTSALETAGDLLLKQGLRNLGKLTTATGFASICPECVAVLTVAAGLDSLNNSLTFYDRLETYDYYIQEPVFESPLDYPVVLTPGTR